MSTKQSSNLVQRNIVQKTAVRCALVTAATISTLIGAQTLAFGEILADLQAQNQAMLDTAYIANEGDIGLSNQPTSVPESTSNPYTVSEPTAPYITLIPKQVQSSAGQSTSLPTLVPTQQVQVNVQPTTQPTVPPTITSAPTAMPQPAVQQVRPSRSQPRPRSEESKP